MLVMAGVLLSVTVALAGASTLLHTHRRAAAAADLAALAGAGAQVSGADACSAAATVAAANGGTLRACAPEGPDVTVQVSFAVPGWVATFSRREVVARARAGPAEQVAVPGG